MKKCLKCKAPAYMCVQGQCPSDVLEEDTIEHINEALEMSDDEAKEIIAELEHNNKVLKKKLDIAKDILSIAKRYFDEEASELDITGDIAKDINDALKQIEEIK